MMRFANRIALAVLPLVLLAGPAFAAKPGVTPSGSIQSHALTADGSLRSFSGNVTPFGSIVGVLSLQIDHSTGHFTGDFAFAAPGGVVYGTIDGQFTSANTYLEKLTFTGGTGSYAHISGYTDVAGTLNLSDGSGSDVILDGQIYLH